MGKWANRKVEICHPQCVKLRLLVLPLLTFTSRQANFGPLSRGQSHLSDVNHSVLLLIFDPIVTGSFVARLSHQTQKESNLFKYSLIGQFVDWSFLLKVLDFALTMKTFARSETNEFFDIIRYFL